MINPVAAAGLIALGATGAAAAALGAYNVDPSSVSVSGLSSGGYMSVQLGVAYSDIFQVGFGVFAGGPYDCARNQYYTSCMYNANPSTTTPVANMKSRSGSQIATINNLAQRKIYMWVGSSDTTVGPNVMSALGASHTFPTDFDGSEDNSCSTSSSPYISNCNYDGAGAALKWLYGSLTAKNTGTLSGSIVSFDQTGNYVSSGMGSTGYLYVPANCQGGSTVCKLHVALHGCLQSYTSIGSKFIDNTGYNKWADTNNIIILYPQATTDSTSHTVWNGGSLPNPNGCWDWVGWYGTNADQIGGVQMSAIVSQVKQIISGYNSASGSSSSTTSTTSATSQSTLTTTTTSTASTATATSYAALYGQCGGIGWTGPTACSSGVCTAYSAYYAQCLLPVKK
ncbi:Putative Poly(3-hydroxybutyrate) depolymerase [Penicillium brasilianum]|uniref:Putative Poly(3-hydroxybutyrate) depolymerase n=1 Tax=Penicillium brasilianum TaxID=104259 RepID=A0A0F7U1U5_PENBI|nr:Putative Poly(3-hydroxybutyrate) depolymerase [Penicillium brasilianum]